MAKSKYAPALFEVISSKDEKSPGKLSLPKWWRNRAGQAAPSVPLQPPAEEPRPVIEGAPEQPAETGAAGSSPTISPPEAMPAVLPAVIAEARPTSSAAPAPPLAEDEAPPLARVREGRVEFSLNPTRTVILAGGLVVLLFIAFELGRGVGTPTSLASQSTASDELEGVQNSTPDLNVLKVTPAGKPSSPAGRTSAGPTGHTGGGSTAPKPPTGSVGQKPSGSQGPAAVNRPLAGNPATPEAAQRSAGLNYAVIQIFNADDQAEAEQLQQWLRSKHGIETVLEGGNGNRWQLVSSVGFDLSDAKAKQKGDQYLAAIKDLGRQYKTDFGSKANYDMRAPFFKQFRK